MSSRTKATAKTEEAKPALVPKLRFPEFRMAESWHPYVLEELEELGWVELGRGEVISGQDIKAIPGCYPIYSSSVKNSGLMGTYGRFMFDEELISWSIDGGGDFFHRPTHKFSVTNVSGFMRLKTSHLNYRFLANHLQALHASLTFDYQFKAHPSVIRKLYRLAIPAPAEQQKLAECLSSVDKLIAAQARKVDALKTHKKGLMQQLFPREGEIQPRLRFPEFQNAGDWALTTIGDLKPFVTSGSRGWAPFYAEQGELFVRITNLWRDSISLDLTDSKFVQLPPGANEGVRTQLKEHDLLISITADIGIIGYVDESVPSPAYINQHIALVRFDAGQLCGKYVAYFLASEKSQRLFRASTDTGTKAGMSLIGIQKIQLMLPGLPEQHRIAFCLSSLDALITAETQKHEALKTHKKGLMQQLFPSPEAVEV